MDRSILDVHYTCRICGKKFSSWAPQDDINFAKKKKQEKNKKEGNKEDKITKKQMMLRRE